MDDFPENEVQALEQPTINQNETTDYESKPVQPEPVVKAPEPQPVVVDPIVVAPVVATPVAPSPVEEKHNNPGLIVLQWLTYAFWGGTVIAASILSTITLMHYIAGTNVGDSIVYAVAATLVLLPISVVCDIFYIKQEPEKKTGASTVIMAIHAVLFALFGIGSLVTIVMSLVTITISSSNLDSTMVTLYSAIIIAVLLAALFLRTLLPKKLFKFRKYFVILMIIVVGGICAFAIFGPVVDARLTRNDRLIESGLPNISTAIDSYAGDHNQLPDTLSALTLTGDAKKLVTDNLVRYQKDAAPSTQSSYDYSSYTLFYQLCVSYTKASSTQYPDETSSSSNGYSSYPYTYSHPAGDKCYKLETAGNNINMPLTN